MSNLSSKTELSERPGDSMLAAVYRGRRTVVLEQLPIPHPGRGELVVRVERCGVCPTDLKKIHLDLQPPPRIFGHEIAGTVAEVGDGVTEWKPGDRVSVFHHVPCRVCHYCRHGSYAQCPQYKQTGTVAAFEPAGGGFAGYVLVREWIVRGGLVRLPDSVGFDEGALLEPLATCLKAVRRANVQAGMTCVVLGQGPIGLMLTGIVSRAGARALVVEPRPDRARVAPRFGAQGLLPAAAEQARESVLSETQGRGADVVLMAVPAPLCWPLAVSLVRAGGLVLFFADTHLGHSIAVDPGVVCFKEVTLAGSYSSDISLQEEAAALLFEKPAQWRSLISHVMPLSDIHLALELASTAPENTLKVVVAP